jgi:FkbM family methyltransferase
MVRKLLSRISLFIRFVQSFGLRNAFKLIYHYERTSGKVRSYRLPHFNNELFLRCNQTDYRLIVSILCHEEYKSKWIFKHIKQPGLIIDAGANIGLFALYMHQHYPQAEIVCIEPEKGNFEVLSRNTNGISKIKPMKAALWSRKAFVNLDDKGEGDWAFQADEVLDGTSGSIPTVTIPDILKDLQADKIDILKIDIEGSERELFLENYQTWLPKVNCLIIELHDSYRRGCGNSLFRAIANYDYFFTKKGENLIFIKSELIN